MRRQGGGMLWRLFNLVAAALVTGALLYLCSAGYGPLPPLGAAFVPGTGVWSVAASSRLPTTGTLHIAGLQRPASVVFDHGGIAHVRAATDHDLWLVNGYLHARFRLFEMDLLRRQGEGRLAQIVGPAALSTDRFELKLGLLRTAQAEWHGMAPGDPARSALVAYSQGVNDGMRELKGEHQLPVLFTLLGYEPRPWSPVDTLVVQGDETQTLDFDDGALNMAALIHSLGYQRTLQWFPVIPADAQHPYDPGPYRHAAPTPLAAQPALAGGIMPLVTTLQREIAALPAGAIHTAGNSNNWAINGPRTASGKALMAGDPHLRQTLPAIWYEWSGDSPSYHFNGVGIPGTPGIIIGHNRHISWSLTNVQNQATLYYRERIDGQHRYFWRGAWHPMRRITYSIPVKGGSTEQYTVSLTVHGPIATSQRLPGVALAIWWVGAIPTPDFDALLGIMQAGNFGQFRSALRNWRAPSQNFIYADDAGNIGLIAAGYYPLVRSGDPWHPLPGDGSADVTGTIPYASIPQVYDPKNHLVFSANQRPVTAAYPYYIGTAQNFFENGYRADQINAVLSSGRRLTVGDMERLQNDVHDYLARLIVPHLLAALHGGQLTATEQAAARLLAGWDGGMRAASPSASIWWVFWQKYLDATFLPWWNAGHVPYHRFSSLRIGPDMTALVEDLEQWTLHDNGNAAFTPPGSAHRTAASVMRLAFQTAVATLEHRLGGSTTSWRWGRLHRRQFDSLALIPSLGYGPRAAGGDAWTVDAAGGYTATGGPSWRFIMDWGTGRGEGVYPGGQSENPLSPWYQNQINTWWSGHYYPMMDAAAARATRGSVTWTLRR